MTEEIFITVQGKKELEEQLHDLKSEMVEVIEKIKEAREFGDLSENAEYDAAKMEQAQIDAKILEIEATLRLAKVVDASKMPKDVVSLGCTVKVKDLDFHEDIEYQIVGSTEADPLKHKLSNASPVGSALIGKKKGETVTVKTPGGETRLKIVKIL